MKENIKENGTYGLFTAITMIVGIVVGSGIYFKSDDIIIATNGNILLGIFVLVFCSLGMVFGSLSVSEYSIRVKGGTVIDFYLKYINKDMAIAYGNFQFLVLFPTVGIIVAWVAAIYTFNILEINPPKYMTYVVGIMYIFLITIINIYSKKLGGYLQNISTILKLVPIFLVGILAIFLINKFQINLPNEVLEREISSSNASWLTAVLPIIFSYEGWMMATNIAKEVKNPEKNMNIALVVAPLIVVIGYIIYFVGLSILVTPEGLMKAQDDAISILFSQLFGSFGGKAILIVILISILGVCNGVTLCGMRIPYLLSKDKLINLKGVDKVDEKYGVSIKAAVIYFIICTIWMIIHYITTTTGVIGNNDVSEIAVIFNYIICLPLYLSILKNKEVINKLRGYISPLIAILFTIIITIISLIVNPFYIMLFFTICTVITILSVKVLKNE